MGAGGRDTIRGDSGGCGCSLGSGIARSHVRRNEVNIVNDWLDTILNIDILNTTDFGDDGSVIATLYAQIRLEHVNEVDEKLWWFAQRR